MLVGLPGSLHHPATLLEPPCPVTYVQLRPGLLTVLQESSHKVPSVCRAQKRCSVKGCRLIGCVSAQTAAVAALHDTLATCDVVGVQIRLILKMHLSSRHSQDG